MTSSPPSNSDGHGSILSPRPSSAFDRLHPLVQRWIWEQAWTELRDAQEAAVEPVLAGDADVIIAAATASGKTEAAFLPIGSALVSAPAAEDSGVQALYISPLKALINDQYGRLTAFCERLEVPVHRWHGDVAGSKKAKVLRAPGGLLLITPESLEALFVAHGPRVPIVFAGLRYVLVDELHSFIGTERGAQLQSLLRRVELAVRRRVPRIGLSATLGDMRSAADFLRPGGGEAVKTIVSGDDSQELKLQLRGYIHSAPHPEPEEVDGWAEAPDEEDSVNEGDRLAISEHLFATLRGADNLIFANSREQVETYADLLAGLSERHRVPNEFWPHHGSLSKDLREHVEARLKDRNRPVNAVCTSTLEMGIDIGTVSSIAQIGAPPSVSALRQRLGRSGRRGDPAVLRIYISEDAVTPHTPPPDSLRAELVQSIAMVRLLLGRWYEPPVSGDLHLSTLVQQVLSLIAQHGGVRPAEAYSALCEAGPFAGVSRSAFATLLRNLGGADLITQASDGTLLLGRTGERIVNHYSFYAAFATPEEYTLYSEGRLLGTLPIDQPLTEGTLLIFAGRRWRVLSVDESRKVVDLARAKGGRPPRFTGAHAPIHDRVRREMLDVYRGKDMPPFLDPTARTLLAEARQYFTRYRLDECPALEWGADTLLFLWKGDRVMGTAAVALAARGLEVSADGLALSVSGTSPDNLRKHLERMLAGGVPDATALAASVVNKESEKYDWVLKGPLLDAAYAARSLDPPGAWRSLRGVLDHLTTGRGETGPSTNPDHSRWT